MKNFVKKRKVAGTIVGKMINAGKGRICNICGRVFDQDQYCGSGHEMGKSYPKS